MKKSILLLMTIIPMIFIGCQKEDSKLSTNPSSSERTISEPNSPESILLWFISSTSSSHSFQFWKTTCFEGTFTTTNTNNKYFPWKSGDQTTTTVTFTHSTGNHILTKGVWYYVKPTSPSGATILKFKLLTDSSLVPGSCFEYNPSTDTWTPQSDVNLVIDEWTTVSSFCTDCC